METLDTLSTSWRGELQEDEDSFTCSLSAASLSDESFDDESIARQDMVETQNGENPIMLDGWGIAAICGAGYHLGSFVSTVSPGLTMVRSAVQRTDFHPYGVKTCSSCGQHNFASQFDGIWSEYELLRTLVHPSIVSVAFLFYSKYDIWLFREWCTDGSLWTYVLEHRELEEPQAWSLVDQMVEGVHFLHGKGLVHQNLQPSNLLLTKHAQILKIVGFSKSATTCDNGTIWRSVMRSMPAPTEGRQRRHELAHESKAWMAPEQICVDLVSQPADIWSCGLCVAFMLLRRHPFSSKTLNACEDLNVHTLRKAVRSMCRGNSLELKLEGLSFGAKSFLELCLQTQPAARACSKVLRLHPMLVPDILQCPLKTGRDGLDVLLEHFQRKLPLSLAKSRLSAAKPSAKNTESTDATEGTLSLLQPEA